MKMLTKIGALAIALGLSAAPAFAQESGSMSSDQYQSSSPSLSGQSDESTQQYGSEDTTSGSQDTFAKDQTLRDQSSQSGTLSHDQFSQNRDLSQNQGLSGSGSISGQSQAGVSGGTSDQSLGGSSQGSMSQSQGTMSQGQFMHREFRASQLIGSDLKNRQGETLGRVQDIVLDQQGRVAFIAVSNQSTQGATGQLTAVPFAALAHESGQLVLDMSKDRFASAPSFSQDQWPNLEARTFTTDIFRYYGVRPDQQFGSQSQEFKDKSHMGSQPMSQDMGTKSHDMGSKSSTY